MDIRKVKKLIELLEESGVSEIEIKEGEESVRISRHPTGTMHAIATPMAYSTPAAAIGAAAGATAGTSAAASAAASAGPSPDQLVTAPMVGTFYRSSAPGAKPFAEVGSTVAVGDPLCIIEAMKLMNEIDSEYEGEITNIYVENGQPVQYGERIFAIRLRS